jgi:hypothetical protein
MRSKEWPDDRSDNACQSMSAVSSRSLGKRCAGISIGPSSGGAPSRKPHATSLPLMRSSRTWDCISRINVASTVLALGFRRRTTEPRKAERLALIPLTNPRHRCLRLSIGHGRANRDKMSWSPLRSGEAQYTRFPVASPPQENPLAKALAMTPRSSLCRGLHHAILKAGLCADVSGPSALAAEAVSANGKALVTLLAELIRSIEKLRHLERQATPRRTKHRRGRAVRRRTAPQGGDVLRNLSPELPSSSRSTPLVALRNKGPLFVVTSSRQSASFITKSRQRC